MSKNYKFSNLKIKFDYLENDFFSIWQWKLDAYRVSDCTHYDVVVCKEDIKICLDEYQLILEENMGFFVRQVHKNDNGYIFTCKRRINDEVYLQYLVNKTFDRIALVFDKTDTNGQFAFEYLCFIMPAVCLVHHMLTFHGVLMEVNGKGIILSADSGVGKTTHARLWRDYEKALIINGDRATCLKEKDQWMGYGLPWSGSSGEQINRHVPIQAFVLVERGEENRASRLNAFETISAVLSHILCPKWDDKMVNIALDLLDDFLKEIPVIRLQCKPDVESVKVLKSILEEI